MESSEKNTSNIKQRISDTQIIHDFQKETCIKCVYWDKGCHFQNSCAKLHRYKTKIRVEESKKIKEEMERMKKIPRAMLVEKHKVKPVVEETIKLLESLIKTDINKKIFEIIEQKNKLEELKKIL